MPPRYSVVVPFHDEQESVRELHSQLSAVMSGRFDPVEFVYVDDQSSDATPQILAEIAAEDPRVAVLRLKRNYGQTTALAAGFDYASGEIIISMDGDLQHDPADIPTLLGTMDTTGCDIVSGWRQKRVDNFILRRLPSRIANWMMAKLSGVDIHDFGTTFKVYRREIIKDVPLYGEMHRFIPALAAWNGAKDRRSSDSQHRAAGWQVPLRNFAHVARLLRHHYHSILDALYDSAAALLWAAGIVGAVRGRRDSGISDAGEDLHASADFRRARATFGAGHDAMPLRGTVARGGAGGRAADADAFRVARESDVQGGTRVGGVATNRSRESRR